MTDDSARQRRDTPVPAPSGILRRPRRIRPQGAVADCAEPSRPPPAGEDTFHAPGSVPDEGEPDAGSGNVAVETAANVPGLSAETFWGSPDLSASASAAATTHSDADGADEAAALPAIADEATAILAPAVETMACVPEVGDSVGASHEMTQAGMGRESIDAPAPPERRAASPTASKRETQGGLRLPGYRILKVLGKGGMGEVCLAERISSAGVPVTCVVKTILPHATSNHQYRDLFLDEARLVSFLRHPNVVTVMECGQHEDVLFQAMEWIEGLDAGELMTRATEQESGIPLRHLLYLLREVLQGLHYAHTAVDHEGQPLSIVHRDISPGNILISRHGAVKLADFGVAVGTASHTEGARESLAGKPHYFAPELWKGTPASPQSDVFALGVSFFELLSGRALFDRSASLRALAWEICHFSVDELLERELTIPDGLEPVIRRSLASEPAERYVSALEFLEDVNDYAYEYGIRLLDAHFARYIDRVLNNDEDGRRHLFANNADDE